MPFNSVQELKVSDLWARLPADIRQMSSPRLARFIAVFNRIFERVSRGGGDRNEADARAIPFAISAVRAFAPPPAGRTAEDKVHFFALMAEDMLHSGNGDPAANVSAELELPDAEEVDIVMAGSTANFSHDRLDPQLLIRQVIATKDAPDDVRELVDPDIPFVAVASYFDDVPAEERLATISPEWTEFRGSGGRTLAIPTGFATTDAPANDPTLGIKKVADGPTSKPYNDGVGMSSRGLPMSDEQPNEELANRVASLTSELEEMKASAAEAEGLKTEVADLKTRLAGLAGQETEDKSFDAESATKAAEERIASLETGLKDARSAVEEMQIREAKAKAEAFADDIFKTKDVAADAKDNLKELYLKDAESAEKWASVLPKRSATAGAGPRAAVALEPVDAMPDDVIAQIDKALGLDGGEVA